ncbi:MAG: protoheme IX farnesyltransferase [Calditrichia bacterium]|nr:protoheme IX farnesyltransferase [Calditrichota bacterium]MCB9070580.1 protoheme IX farnesyltransferase [Calditrichia bacterium]
MIQTYQAAGVREWAGIVIELSKIRISQLVAMSTILGYIMATGELSLFLVVPALGTFLLSCGSSALNQFQEWQYDSKMLRTRYRPIPSGRISPETGLKIAIALMVSGAVILGLFTNFTAFALGLFNILWYNGVYTPLKRKTAFAVIPGSLIGAIPPAIGWAASGRGLEHPQIMAIGLFFFIWQVPHFWLLILNLSEDYQRAGFPTLSNLFDQRQISRLTFMWTLATALSCLMIPLFGIGHSVVLHWLLYGAAFWLIWMSRELLSSSEKNGMFRAMFMRINIYMLVVMVFLSIDRLIV